MDFSDTLLGELRQRIQDHRRRTDFSERIETALYPPALAQDVREAERILAFKLVLLHFRLYTEVGNGGFGPGYGILGVGNGYVDADGRSLVDAHTFVSLIERQSGRVWPAGMLPLCAWGSAVWSCIDCKSKEGAIWTQHEAGLTRTRHSLQSWLEAWMAGTSLWEEMFDFETIEVRNPFSGQPTKAKVRRAPKK